MGKIFLTSDLHLNHNQPFLYGPRGFDDVFVMNQIIIYNWNSVVDEDDEVYCLGDLAMGDAADALWYLNRLNGRIHLILGNHDSDAKIAQYCKCPNIVEISYAARLRYHKYNFYLTHYPTLCGNLDDGKKLKQHTICLCGHSHTSDPFADWPKGLIYHCELDAHNLYPVLLDDIIKEMKVKFNEMG